MQLAQLVIRPVDMLWHSQHAQPVMYCGHELCALSCNIFRLAGGYGKAPAGRSMPFSALAFVLFGVRSWGLETAPRPQPRHRPLRPVLRSVAFPLGLRRAPFGAFWGLTWGDIASAQEAQEAVGSSKPLCKSCQEAEVATMLLIGSSSWQPSHRQRRPRDLRVLHVAPAPPLHARQCRAADIREACFRSCQPAEACAVSWYRFHLPVPQARNSSNWKFFALSRWGRSGWD